MARCRFGCPEQPGDLRHYVRCARAWPDTLRAFSMRRDPTWEVHFALAGDATQRIAIVRAWVAVYGAYSILRHDENAEVASELAAGVDHARIRIPPGLGRGEADVVRALARGRNGVMRVPNPS